MIGFEQTEHSFTGVISIFALLFNRRYLLFGVDYARQTDELYPVLPESIQKIH